jgi:hypothetical protein
MTGAEEERFIAGNDVSTDEEDDEDRNVSTDEQDDEDR